MNEVTRILDAAAQGDGQAAHELLPLVYDELRRLAARKLAHEAPGQTLAPTALVHEAYLRLVGNQDEVKWEGRRHFFGAAAEAMRRILVENARRKHSQKRGGGKPRQALDPSAFAAPEHADDLLAVHQALDQLAAADAQAAELVKLRYFAGLTLPEVAEALAISPRTADRLWSYARAWLFRAIHRE